MQEGDPTNCVQVLAEEGRVDERSCPTTQIYRPELIVEQSGPGESAYFTLQAQANAPGVVLFEVHVSSSNTVEGGFGEKEQTTLCGPCPTERAGN